MTHCIRGITRPGEPGAAERPLGYLPLLRAAKGTAPVFNLMDARGCLRGHFDNRILVCQEVAALNCVICKFLPAVMSSPWMVPQRGVNPSLCGYGVRPQRMYLGYNADTCVHLIDRNRRPQSRKPASNNQYVVVRHQISP